MGLLLGAPSLRLQQLPHSAPSTGSSLSDIPDLLPLSAIQQGRFRAILDRTFAATEYPLFEDHVTPLFSSLYPGSADDRDTGAERRISNLILSSSSSLSSEPLEHRVSSPVQISSQNATPLSNFLTHRHEPSQRQLSSLTSASRSTSNTASNVQSEEGEAQSISQTLQDEDMNTDNALKHELMNHITRFREHLIGGDAMSIEGHERSLMEYGRVGEGLIHTGELIISDFKVYEDYVERITQQLAAALFAVSRNVGRGGAQWGQIINSQKDAFEAAQSEMCRIQRAQDRMRGLIRTRKQELGI